MKKWIIVLFSIAVSLIAICFGKSPALSAFAATELSVDVEYVPSNALNILVQNQYNYRVTVYISDAEEIYGGGFSTYYDFSHFNIIMDPNSSVSPYIEYNYEITGNLAGAARIDPEIGRVGFGFMASDPPFVSDDDDGDEPIKFPIFSFYVYSQNKSDIDANPSIVLHIVTGIGITDLNDQYADPIPDDLDDVTPTAAEFIYYSFIYGDINGDGTVDLTDAQLLNTFISQHPNCTVNTPIDADDLSGSFSGFVFQNPAFITDTNTEGKIVVLLVADVNGDGYINSADANAIMSYYVDDLLGYPHDDDEIIGTEYVYSIQVNF